MKREASCRDARLSLANVMRKGERRSDARAMRPEFRRPRVQWDASCRIISDITGLSPFFLVARPQHRTRFCAREALVQPSLWRLSVATDEERNIVKAHDSRRPSRRRTPEELAQDHEDALRWRTKLRAEAGSLTAETSAATIATPKSRSERSRFAAAIARAEFGRFYFKEMRSGRSPKPARRRNGKAE